MRWFIFIYDCIDYIYCIVVRYRWEIFVMSSYDKTKRYFRQVSCVIKRLTISFESYYSYFFSYKITAEIQTWNRSHIFTFCRSQRYSFELSIASVIIYFTSSFFIRICPIARKDISHPIYHCRFFI